MYMYIHDVEILILCLHLLIDLINVLMLCAGKGKQKTEFVVHAGKI